jgi:hypothetical protein
LRLVSVVLVLRELSRSRASGILGIHQRGSLLAAQLEDTGGMNRERAETFLRLLAEGVLRRVHGTAARQRAAAGYAGRRA